MSEFIGGLSQPDQEDYREEISTSSERFRFFKVRLYGVMHLVKTPSDKYKGDFLTIESLRKEFLLGYGLDHPSIVRYFKFDGESIYEEFIDGQTLRQLIDSNDPRIQSSSFLLNVCLGILESLAYLHSHGIVHLDLKPENVMVERIGNNVRIIDLGCARSAGCDSTPGFSLEYMAPEQNSADTDHSTDIYLLGRIMKELSRAANKSKEWNGFVNKATKEDPSLRFVSAEEAIEFLNHKTHTKRNILLALTTILFLSIISLLIWFFISPSPVSTHSKEKLALTDDTPADSLIVFDAPGETSPPLKEDVKNPAPAPISAPIGKIDNGIQIETKLKNQIETHIADYYNKNIKPLCADSLREGNGRFSLERTSDFSRALTKAYNYSLSFGNDLISQYPDKEVFIRSSILSAVEYQSARYNSIFHQQK